MACMRAKQPLFACFLDHKGAYDRVQRPMLWQVLQRLKNYGGMLAAIKSIYKDSRSFPPGARRMAMA